MRLSVETRKTTSNGNGKQIQVCSILLYFNKIKTSLKSQGKLPELYRRYVDDTLVKMPNLVAATAFLDTLNHAHSAVSFTMEVEENGMLPFLGVQLLNRAPCIETKGLR